MKVKRSHFKHKIHIVLCLLGLIPYLLTAYLFMRSNLNWTESIGLLAALIFAFHLAGFYLLRRFSDELMQLVKCSEKNNDHTLLAINHNDTDEVFHIKENFNNLLQKLQTEQENFSDVIIRLLKESRKDSQEYERRLRTIRPYVDHGVLQSILIEKSCHTELRSERRRVSVLFVDICSFTKASEELQASEVVDLLNDFFNASVRIIYQNNGVVDKFIGDAIMAVFGLGSPKYQVSIDAICAGLELQDAAKRLFLTRKKQGKKTFKVRVGINTGNVIAGDIGSLDRMDYTVIGDTVNVASRLSDHAGAGGVLVSNHTYATCHEYFKVEAKGHIKVKNRTKKIEAFTVIEKNERAFKQHQQFLSSGKISMEKFSQLR